MHSFMQPKEREHLEALTISSKMHSVVVDWVPKRIFQFCFTSIMHFDVHSNADSARRVRRGAIILFWRKLFKYLLIQRGKNEKFRSRKNEKLSHSLFFQYICKVLANKFNPSAFGSATANVKWVFQLYYPL